MARSLLNVPVNKFAIVHGVLKVIAMLCGLALSQICLMASVGLFTESGWIRVLVGLAANLLVPLAFVDRVLPKDPTKSKGLASDVLALCWLGFPFVFAVVGQGFTGPALAREAGRLNEVGFEGTAWLTYQLAGVDANAVSPGPPAAPAGSGSAATSASAPPATSAPPTGSGSAAASASAGPATSAVPEEQKDAGAPKSKDKTPADLFKALSPSVVTISFTAGLGSGGGTGFLVDDQGTIATNHHVISSAKKLQIKFVNGSLFRTVELLAEDADRDLALLRIKIDEPEEGSPQVEAEPLTLGDSDEVVVGERAIAIGNPLGLEHTLTDGLVSARRLYQGKPWIQMSVPVSPGNSGGPLFNMRGEVIGVITAQITGGYGGRAQNLNLAVPVNALKKMIHSKYPNRRAFGSPGGSTQW